MANKFNCQYLSWTLRVSLFVGKGGGKYAGGNSVCDRPTPDWQKGIGGFLVDRPAAAEVNDPAPEVNNTAAEVNDPTAVSQTTDG